MFDGEYDSYFIEAEPEIRQGDVIQFIPQHDVPILATENWVTHLGVVVTANCDLAHDKHGGILSFVPLVPLEVYAANLTIPRIGTQLSELLEKNLRDALPTGKGWPTLGRIYELFSEGESADTISHFFPKTEIHDDVVQLVKEIEACVWWKKAHEKANTWTEVVDAAGNLFVSLRKIKKQKSIPKGDLLRKELRNRILKQLPGDALFLAAPAPEATKGYIAYLRIIREIHFEKIATSAMQERLGGSRIAARRIGRILPLYLHKLTQQMAAVFTAIGLPKPYEEHRDTMLELVLEEWTKNR